MIGNPDSERRAPLFLLDESLAPVVARSLALVGYNISTISDEFGRTGVKDPEIIEWCKLNDAVWIHADDSAKREHKKLLQTSGIRTLWIYRKRGGMAAREQLRIISHALPRLMRGYGEQPRIRHYRASAVNETSNPLLRRQTI